MRGKSSSSLAVAYHQQKTTTLSFLFSLVTRVFFPSILVLWFLLFVFSKAPVPKSLRGNNNIDGGINNNLDVVFGDRSSKKSFVAVVKQTETATTQQQQRHNLPPALEELNHVVIVAGHAVLRINKVGVADKDDSAWYLLGYQTKQGFPGIITSHIKRGIQEATVDPRALLIFSGGQTRRDVGPTSEAASYYYLAQEKKWFSGLLGRVHLEEYARDSYENLLYSICRFREVAGTYPQRVTVIGFDFKLSRFRDLHRKAIGYPSLNFSYIGLRPEHPKFDHTKAAVGEASVIASFEQDLYACSDALSDKKIVRNPFKRTVPYELACPEIRTLLHWCGPQLFDPSGLPWNNAHAPFDGEGGRGGRGGFGDRGAAEAEKATVKKGGRLGGDLGLDLGIGRTGQERGQEQEQKNAHPHQQRVRDDVITVASRDAREGTGSG